MYRNDSFEKATKIEIALTRESVSLNGQQTDSIQLGSIIYKFIIDNSPNYVIIFNSSEHITYKRYIEFLDILYTQIDRLRNELSFELYNQPFENSYWPSKFDSIKTVYPRNIIEWSSEEERLQNLIKKTGSQK